MARLWAIGLVALGLLAGCAGVELHDIRIAEASRDQAKLFAWLESPKAWVREEAALALGRAGPPEAARRLEQIVGDQSESSWVRAAALEGLGALRDPASLPVVIGAASSMGAEPEVKLAAIEAACRVDPRGAATAIAPMIKDEDLLVAAFAESLVKVQCAR